jgi:hypothetical protein
MSESPLDNLHIASPCHASWEAMSGNDKARFCKSCQKNVFNISMMTRQQAESLIHSREGNLCVRYAQREDGTVITNDCPVGIEKAKSAVYKPWRFFVASVAGIIAAICGALGISPSFAQPPIDPPSRIDKTLKVVGRIAPIPKTNQAPPVLMGEMPAHSTSSQAPVLMGKPAPLKQPVNVPVLQGGLAPPKTPTATPIVSQPKAHSKNIALIGRIALKQKAKAPVKAATKNTSSKSALKKHAKKR